VDVVLRFLLSGRQVVLHVLALVLVATMVWLGHWQLDKALHQVDAPPHPAADPAPAALDRLSVAGQSLPNASYGRRVRTSGHYDRHGQVLVAGHRHGGRTGFWVATPLRLAGGGAVVVVRGWVPDPHAPAVSSVPDGRVTVTGRVYPSEDSTAQGASLPRGQVSAVDPLALRQDVSYDLRDGFVVATGQSPAASPAPAPVVAKPWPSQGQGFPLQNSAYAVQWWLFSAFVVFMWARILRERRRRERDPSSGREPGDGAGGEPGAPEALPDGLPAAPVGPVRE